MRTNYTTDSKIVVQENKQVAVCMYVSGLFKAWFDVVKP